jgi:SAM-dependent methyltransferase
MARSSAGASTEPWRPPGPDPRDALAPLEQALREHMEGSLNGSLNVVTDDGGEQELPVALFFRAGRDLLPADRAALALCRGRVLDVGAGAGALALPLQAAGHEVTALEVLPGAAAVLWARGVRDVRLDDLWIFRPDRPYDTVLALMNGTAAAGTLAGLAPLLGALAAPLATGGQVLMDSTDMREEGRPSQRPDGRYVGELQYRLEYEGERGPPFPQLFVDSERLADAAVAAGLLAEIVWRGDEGEFLVRLVRT